MKVYANCPLCNKAYDATEWPRGAKFLCLCSGTIEVPGQSASIIDGIQCCGSCGAPRALRTDEKCAHCDSLYADEARTMSSHCSECLHAIRSSAKFCCFCGSHVKSLVAIVKTYELQCPSCSSKATTKFVERNLKSVDSHVLECTACKGVWVTLKTLDLLQQQAVRASTMNIASQEGLDIASLKEIASTGPEVIRYKKCPECSSVMNRRNMESVSGIIADWCGKHGFWFDKGELGEFLSWVQGGGIVKAREHQLQLAKEEFKRVKDQPNAFVIKQSED